MTTDRTGQLQDPRDSGTVIPFEPRMAVTALLGIELHAENGSVTLALRGARHPRVEVVMPAELAEQIAAAVSRTFERVRQGAPAP